MYWGVPFIDERCSAPDALSRSYHLSAGNWWRGTTIVTVALIIVIVLTLVVSFVLGIITVIGGSDLLVRSILTQSLGSVLGIFLTPALPAAFVAGYFDLRLRREGDDLAARVGKLTSN